MGTKDFRGVSEFGFNMPEKWRRPTQSTFLGMVPICDSALPLGSVSVPPTESGIKARYVKLDEETKKEKESQNIQVPTARTPKACAAQSSGSSASPRVSPILASCSLISVNEMGPRFLYANSSFSDFLTSSPMVLIFTVSRRLLTRTES